MFWLSVSLVPTLLHELLQLSDLKLWYKLVELTKAGGDASAEWDIFVVLWDADICERHKNEDESSTGPLHDCLPPTSWVRLPIVRRSNDADLLCLHNPRAGQLRVKSLLSNPQDNLLSVVSCCSLAFSLYRNFYRKKNQTITFKNYHLKNVVTDNYQPLLDMSFGTLCLLAMTRGSIPIF